MIDVITDSDQITVSQPTDFKGIVGIGNEYHVDARIINDIPMGSNKNPGTSDKPLATIAEAIRRIKPRISGENR